MPSISKVLEPGALSRVSFHFFFFVLTGTERRYVINFPRGSIKVIPIVILIAIVRRAFKAEPLPGNKQQGWRMTRLAESD